MKADLQILLLGPPQIRQGDKIFQLQPATARALLFYLASKGGLIRGEELFPLFWENETKAGAQRCLSQVLDELRFILPDPGVILDQDGLFGLDSTKVVVDQREFLNFIDQAGRDPWQNPAHDPLPERTAQLLQRAVSLWRSPRFLDGADLFDKPALHQWLLQTGQRMERQFVRVATRLSEHAYRTGDLDSAFTLAQSALQIDALNEDLHARSMKILTEKGQPEDANRYYDRLQELYRRELDTNPSPRLIALYRQIRVHRNPDAQPHLPVVWKVRQSVPVPFVGRQQVLEQLNQAFQQGGGVWVIGEPGQGKTRLFQEFTSRLEPQPRLLLATCRPAESNLPFQPLIEMFRHQLLAEEWLSLPLHWANQLSLLIPEIASMRADLELPVFEAEPHVTPEQARAVLLEAIRQVLYHLVDDRRLILCLDDAHWSDEATLAAVQYLLQRPPFDRQALLLLAARKEQSNLRLDATLEGIRQTGSGKSGSQPPQPPGHFQVIHLPRFSQDEIVELAYCVTGHTPSEQLIHLLVDETGGNPFFLLETLRILAERDIQMDTPALAPLPLPRSIRALINDRLDQLAPSVRRTLEAAAILGTDFNLPLLSEVSQQSGTKVVEAVEEMVGRLLIEPISGQLQDLHYRLIHDIIREILIQELSPLQKRLLHGRAARALERSFKAFDHAAVLAYHYENAGEMVRAFDYWVQAGQRARQLFSTVEATAAFYHAEQALESNPDLSDYQIHDLYAEWTEVAYENEDEDTIRRINSKLLEIGKKRSSPLLIGTGLDGFSDAFMVSNQFEEGLDYVNQAISYLERSSNLYEQMEAYNHRGVFLYMLNRIEESIEAFQDALALGSASHDTQVVRARANAHYQIAVARTLNGWPKIALNDALRSLADFRIANRPHGQATAYSALALARYFLGEYRQALIDSQMGIEIAERIQAWRILGYLHDCRAMVELATGNIDATVAHAERAIELGERYGHAEIAAGGYRMLGDLYSWMYIDEQAIEFYQHGLEAGQDNFMGVDQMYRLGLSLARSGHVEPGIYWQQQAITIAQNTGLDIILIMANLAEVLTCQFQGKWQEAKELATGLYQDAFRRSIPSIRLYASIALAEIALQHSQVPEALGHLVPAAEESSLLPQPWIEARIQVLLDRSHRLAQKPDAAYCQKIQAILDRIEATASKEPFRSAFLEFREKVSCKE